MLGHPEFPHFQPPRLDPVPFGLEQSSGSLFFVRRKNDNTKYQISANVGRYLQAQLRVRGARFAIDDRELDPEYDHELNACKDMREQAVLRAKRQLSGAGPTKAWLRTRFPSATEEELDQYILYFGLRKVGPLAQWQVFDANRSSQERRTKCL
eukprot:gnl/Hemi2/22563_TR7529_c0_g1_i4.p2 gnl/Hemi2/22563_TR7529_c0_g1~~gnl/Hemi2/22563_TR7529_c0_g1_i4.p2  ORF type:complete len:153 (+),score=1.32 gnl/Hemi2/22563_TR7529_c0_g1_i4:926-1384(+)